MTQIHSTLGRGIRGDRLAQVQDEVDHCANAPGHGDARDLPAGQDLCWWREHDLAWWGRVSGLDLCCDHDLRTSSEGDCHSPDRKP